MINESLTCLKDEMNVFLRNRLNTKEDKVVLSSLVNQDGSSVTLVENKIVITLLNIEKNLANSNSTTVRTMQQINRPLNLNLNIMFSAYFTAANYSESLQLISMVIAFLEGKAVFTSANTPALDENIEKITFEMQTLKAEELHHVWATLGANYMPSVQYKMRMQTYMGIPGGLDSVVKAVKKL